jgi:pimeloyl-ACP methyl ester carboxylesterase
MKTFATLCTLACLLAFAWIAPPAHARGTAPAMKPTIVLVHGAFADSSSWNGVSARLLARGYPVVAVANPLRSVKGDAAYLDGVVAAIDGPVVLVGHSYGGMVISNAGAAGGKVKALVFVAAFAPEAGESAAELSSRFPGSTLGAALAPPVALPDGGKDLYIRQERFHAQFAADLPAADAAAAAVAQRPVTAAALDEPSGAPTWASIPSWSVYGSADRNIPPEAMAFMARRARARRIVEVDGASHVVMASHPDEVARLIVEAAEAR